MFYYSDYSDFPKKKDWRRSRTFGYGRPSKRMSKRSSETFRIVWRYVFSIKKRFLCHGAILQPNNFFIFMLLDGFLVCTQPKTQAYIFLDFLKYSFIKHFSERLPNVSECFSTFFELSKSWPTPNIPNCRRTLQKLIRICIFKLK